MQTYAHDHCAHVAAAYDAAEAAEIERLRADPTRHATRRTSWERTPHHQARMSAADLRGTLGADWKRQISAAPNAVEHSDGSWTWTP